MIVTRIKDPIIIEMCLHREDPRAIFASDDGNWKNAKRLPKAYITYEDDGRRKGVIHVTMPEALAFEKGLI